MIAFNTKKHSSTGFTPYELMCGSRMIFHPHGDRLQKSDSSEKTTNSALVEELSRNRENLVEKAQIYLKKNREEMKKHYDKKVFNFDISLGDIVFLHKHYVRRGESKKLNPLYEGMWEVIDIRGPNYLLQNSKTGKEKTMHHNELRRCPPRSYVRHRGESSKSNVQQYAYNKQGKLTVNRTRAERAPQLVYYPVILEALPGLQIATTDPSLDPQVSQPETHTTFNDSQNDLEDKGGGAEELNTKMNEQESEQSYPTEYARQRPHRTRKPPKNIDVYDYY